MHAQVWERAAIVQFVDRVYEALSKLKHHPGRVAPDSNLKSPGTAKATRLIR